jgi:hypothetical protein
MQFLMEDYINKAGIHAWVVVYNKDLSVNTDGLENIYIKEEINDPEWGPPSVVLVFERGIFKSHSDGNNPKVMMASLDPSNRDHSKELGAEFYTFTYS